MFTRIGEATDVVTKEMYDFVDKGDRHVALRPELTASVCRAYRRAPADDAVEDLVHRLQLPLREAAARPLPPVRPGRHRSARRRRPAPRRRGDRARLGVLPPARAATGHAAASTRSASPTTVPATSRRSRALRGAGRRPVRAEPGDARNEPAAGARLEARARTQPIIAAAPTIVDFWSDDAAEHFAAVQAGLRALDIPFDARTQARPRARLLPPHDVRVRGRHARLRPERPRWRRSLRRPRRGARWPAHRRHRVRARRRPHPARLRRRRCLRGTRHRASTCSSSTRRVASTRSRSPTELRAAGVSARSGVRAAAA